MLPPFSSMVVLFRGSYPEQRRNPGASTGERGGRARVGATLRVSVRGAPLPGRWAGCVLVSVYRGMGLQAEALCGVASVRASAGRLAGRGCLSAAQRG